VPLTRTILIEGREIRLDDHVIAPPRARVTSNWEWFLVAGPPRRTAERSVIGLTSKDA